MRKKAEEKIYLHVIAFSGIPVADPTFGCRAVVIDSLLVDTLLVDNLPVGLPRFVFRLFRRSE